MQSRGADWLVVHSDVIVVVGPEQSVRNPLATTNRRCMYQGLLGVLHGLVNRINRIAALGEQSGDGRGERAARTMELPDQAFVDKPSRRLDAEQPVLDLLIRLVTTLEQHIISTQCQQDGAALLSVARVGR